MTTPRVSVIVPCYNYGHFLADALDSVAAQTFGEWECIVVDDGSTDTTPEVARRYVERDSRFRYVRQENRGLPAARNTGLRETSAAYVQLLDADDRLAPRKLEIHVGHLDAHPEVDIVYSLVTYFRSDAPDRVQYSMYGRLSRPLWSNVTSNAEARARLEFFNILAPLAPVVRRSIFERAGVFNEAVRACEDWDFWLRCAIAGCEFRYLEANASLAALRTHSSSMSRSSERMIRGLIDAALTFRSTAVGSKWREETLPRVYEMALGVHAVEQRHRRAALRHFRRSIRGPGPLFTRARWSIYGMAACVLPRRAFLWLVTRPMPELALEILRRLSGTARQSPA